jgi:hypothetical protein
VSTTRLPQRRAPRVLRVRGRRTARVLAAVVLLPMTLAACGLIGGASNHGADPVIIPTGSADLATGTAAADSGTGSATTSAQHTTQVVVSGGATVTRTGIVMRTQIDTRTNTQTMVATKTLPQVTKISTAAPVTNTTTVTQTVTPAPVTVTGPTVFVTKPCPAAPCA